MTLVDEDVERWYCYKDDVTFYAKEQRWSDKATSTPTVVGNVVGSSEHSKRSNPTWYMLKVFVLIFVIYYALRLVLFYVLYPIVPHSVYAIASLGIYVVVFIGVPVLTYRKILRTPDVTSTRSISVPVSKEVVRDLIPQVILKNKWKLIDADRALGHFKARIGVSIWVWGETMLIDVGTNDEGSTKVDVYCEVTHHQKYDYGKLDKDTDKFYHELQNLIKEQTKL